VSRRRDAFGAIADPTRRAILELLFEQSTMTAGEIAGEFDISQPAVSKHLAVLRDAGLVAVRGDGRERHYTLDPQPLEAIYVGWLSRFAPLWERSLANLKRQVEQDS
jgi:DNA-binding transcriptional ArsR family regulator